MMKNETVACNTTLVLILATLIWSGCSSIGPKTVERDRFDYVMAISESWKKQTLINLLKTRYLDAPVFMDVSSVINSYTLEGEVELGLSWSQNNSQSVGGTGTYTDKPTITYHPLLGARFATSLLRPVPISGILVLMQAGYPSDFVLRVCTSSINGISNRSSGYAGREADPKFYELLDIFRRAQELNLLEIRIRLVEEIEKVFMIVREPVTTDESEVAERFYDLLGLDSSIKEFPVVFGSFPARENEVTILSRSMIQIMTAYSGYIEVPEKDIEEGRVSPTVSFEAGMDAGYPPLVRIRSGGSRPDDAFVSAEYRGHWFWIDDRDVRSKATFYFLMVLFSSTERGSETQATPVITVPTG